MARVPEHRSALRPRVHACRVATVGPHEAGTMRVLGPTGNSRDFAYIDELGMLEFGAAWDGTSL